MKCTSWRISETTKSGRYCRLVILPTVVWAFGLIEMLFTD